MKFTTAVLAALAQAAVPEDADKFDKVRIEVVASSFCCHCGLNWKAFRTAIMSQEDLAAIMDVQLNFLFPLPAGEHQQSAASYAQSYTTNSDYLADGASMCAIKHSKMWPLLTDCIFAKNWDGDFVEPYTTNFWARDEAVFDAELMKCAEALTDYPLQEFRDCVYGKPLEDLGEYKMSESDRLRIKNVNKEHDVWKRMGGKPVATGGITWALVNDVYVTDHSVEQPKAPNWENDAVVGRAPWLAKMIPAICNAWGGDSSKVESCNNVDAIVQKYVEELGEFNPCGVMEPNATVV
jgi:hypothetical protein